MTYASPHRNRLRVVRRIPTQRKRHSLWLTVLLGALAGVALVGGAAYVAQNRPVAVATAVLTEGAVEIALPADALVVRQERVYAAPASGAVRRLVADGQLVRVGTPVAQLVGGEAAAAAAAAAPAPTAAPAGEQQLRRQLDDLAAALYAKAVALNEAKDRGDAAAAAALQTELDGLAANQADLARQLDGTAPAIVTPPPAAPAGGATPLPGPVTGQITADAAGVVVYETDGLEEALAPDKANTWKPSAVRGLVAVPRPTAAVAAKGDPVLKVVDTVSGSLLVAVPEQALARLGAGDQVAVRFAGRDGAPVTAQVRRLAQEGADVLLLLAPAVLPDELGRQRHLQVTLVMGAYRGLVVPRTAIDVRDGKQGVWVVDGTEQRFHPVVVLGGNDDVVALETDLTVGVRVLQNAPTWMR